MSAALQVQRKVSISPAQLPFPSRVPLLSSLTQEKKLPEERTAEVHENKKLAALVQLYLKFEEKPIDDLILGGDYFPAYKLASDLKITQGDINEFLKFLKSFEGTEHFGVSGFFISELINGCAETHITLDLRIFGNPMDFIGNKNTKNVTVFGNLGSYSCQGMREGKFIVNGNAGNDFAVCMHGGMLIVKGDVGIDAARAMDGGKLIIGGTPERNLGDEMDGGTIHINGDFNYGLLGTPDDRGSGKIYHKGKLIYYGLRF